MMSEIKFGDKITNAEKMQSKTFYGNTWKDGDRLTNIALTRSDDAMELLLLADYELEQFLEEYEQCDPPCTIPNLIAETLSWFKLRD
jgi:hypothetical protein